MGALKITKPLCYRQIIRFICFRRQQPALWEGVDNMTKRWWKAAGIRALKTFFQTFVASIGSSAVLESVNWALVLSASALAAILSLATSLAGLPELDGYEVEEE